MTGDSALPHNQRVEDWLAAAEFDADHRGLAELKPILRLYARATIALRAADWNSAGPSAED
jgi:hypothetical protein